jgi:hypothetical protein
MRRTDPWGLLHRQRVEDEREQDNALIALGIVMMFVIVAGIILFG